MEKLDEINLVINEYNDLLTEIADRKNNLRTAKFISSKRIEAINSRNEEIQLKNRENKRLLNEEYSKLEIELENKLKDLDERKERDIKEYLSSDFIKDLNFYDGYIKSYVSNQ